MGRDRELDRIVSLVLRRARLITLVGAGGIGKTRLAAEAVHRLRSAGFSVRWVRLARLSKGADAARVEDEIVRSVVEGDFSGRSAWHALVATVNRSDLGSRGRQLVMVLDNCEHVVEAVGPVVAELLDAAPGLTVLATSREAIGWVDEQLVDVPPLSREQAVSLFEQRAELTGRGVAESDRPSVELVCRHVHNHPLYIRLAAARLRHQPLRSIVRDLSGEAADRRLSWPGVAQADSDARHRAIDNVIAWSYDLCSEREKVLLERMSVFAAGYDVNPEDLDASTVLDIGADVEAIEAVCSDSTGADGPARADIEALLERLADRSLVSTHFSRDAVRYSLLESVRVFAAQQLQRRPGDEWSYRSALHRRYYRDKVGQASVAWFGSREQDLLDWARAAWDNVCCAIEGSLATPEEAVVGLEIALGLIALRVPFFTGTLRESRSWAERALAATRSAGAPPDQRQISAMAMIGWLGLTQGLPHDGLRMLDECLAACSPGSRARARLSADPVADLGLPPPVDFLWGSVLLLVRQDRSAIAVLARARTRFAAARDSGGAAMAELFEALAAAFLGDGEQALEATRRHLGHAADSGAQWALSWAELAHAIALTKHDDPHEAAKLVHTALTRQTAMRDRWGAVWAVHMRAWVLARMIEVESTVGTSAGQRRGEEIAWLIGGAAALRRQLGVDLNHLGPFLTETRRAAGVARKALGRSAFDSAVRAGEKLRPADGEVTRLALGALSLRDLPSDHPIRQGRPTPWHSLSEAEQAVAILAATGWTNAEIATRRGSSPRTVDAQVASVLRKLMISSRTEIARHLPADVMSRAVREARRGPASGG